MSATEWPRRWPQVPPAEDVVPQLTSRALVLRRRADRAAARARLLRLMLS